MVRLQRSWTDWLANEENNRTYLMPFSYCDSHFVKGTMCFGRKITPRIQQLCVWAIRRHSGDLNEKPRTPGHTLLWTGPWLDELHVQWIRLKTNDVRLRSKLSPVMIPRMRTCNRGIKDNNHTKRPTFLLLFTLFSCYFTARLESGRSQRLISWSTKWGKKLDDFYE